MTVNVGLLIALAVIGGGWDLKTRRIPNWLTFPIAAAGLAWNVYTGGFHGLLSSLLGLGLGLVFLLPFFLLGGTGAGDVKMLAAAGAVVGPMSLIYVIVYFAILGGIVAMAMALAYGKSGQVLMNTIQLVNSMLRGRFQQVQHFESATPRLAYGAVIGAGCLLFLFFGPKTI